MPKKAIVTGGAGFIGSHMVDHLLKKGFRVAVIDNLKTGKRENISAKAKFYKQDITNLKSILNIFKKEKPDYVFHFAAQLDLRFSVDNPWQDAKENIIGGINIIEASRRIKLKKFIFSSTGGAIYGGAWKIPTPETYRPHPLSPYGVSKLSFEEYLHCYRHMRQNSLDSVSLRYANVYGPRQDSRGEAGVIAIFARKFLAGKQPIIFGDGKNTRDFVYVSDVVDANWRALMSKNPRHKIFNIGTGKETSINQIFQKLKKLTASQFKPKHGPAKAGEERRSVLACARARQELKWKPKIDLDTGLAMTVDWFR
ncbi:NAD-dependent epimerase/dehydratase family protein [Patescibacteria group bacterium]|nr:NAD-dependent epimerase/dehydratase family protein [Patescibacteria group bacterium]MBU1921979.1 NAD-dependent epimerase/dehydratase family protein [Patescibacteria group bacterium]